MLACANVMRLTMSPKNLAQRKYHREMINAVLNQETGEMMEYRKVMKTLNIENCVKKRIQNNSASLHKAYQAWHTAQKQYSSLKKTTCNQTDGKT